MSIFQLKVSRIQANEKSWARLQAPPSPVNPIKPDQPKSDLTGRTSISCLFKSIAIFPKNLNKMNFWNKQMQKFAALRRNQAASHAKYPKTNKTCAAFRKLLLEAALGTASCAVWLMAADETAAAVRSWWWKSELIAILWDSFKSSIHTI